MFSSIIEVNGDFSLGDNTLVNAVASYLRICHWGDIHVDSYQGENGSWCFTDRHAEQLIIAMRENSIKIIPASYDLFGLNERRVKKAVGLNAEGLTRHLNSHGIDAKHFYHREDRNHQ